MEFNGLPWRLVATDMAALAGPSRAYVVLLASSGPATVIDGGPVDRRSSLPVQVRLPDRQGLADRRQLAWRTGSGAWPSAGRNAALLPAAATEVQVDGGPTAGKYPAVESIHRGLRGPAAGLIVRLCRCARLALWFGRPVSVA